MLRRKSTLSWGRKHAAHIPAIKRALELPMVPEILNTVDENRGGVFYVMALAQVFKSLLGQLRVLRSIQVEQVPTLWYGPTGDNIEDFVAEKLNPLMDSCTPIPRLLFGDKNKRTNERISLPADAYLLLLSAGSEPNRQGKTARDVFFDEPWMFEPGWIEDCQRRHGDYATTFREFFMSTGPTDGAPAANIWKNTDQRIWHVRCPSCAAYFEPRFAHKNAAGDIIGGVRYDKKLREDGLPDAAAIHASAYYECPKCNEHLPNATSSRLALNGTADDPRGLYVASNSSPAPMHFGWNVNGCALRDWGDLSVRWVQAQLARSRGDLAPMERIVRLDFGGIWDPTPDYKTKAVRQVGDYVMGEDWAGELKDENGRPWRFAAIDVQQDHYYLNIRMWGRRSESRLRWAAKCMSVSDIEQICNEQSVAPFRVFMDSRYDSQTVRRICAAKGWKSLMGEKDNRHGYKHPDGIFKIYSEPKYLDAFIGTSEQGRYTVMEILFNKQMALNRLHLLRTETLQPVREAGATEDPPVRPLWTSAKNVPDWYWKQVEGHYLKDVVASDGSVSRVWHGLKDDHMGDLEAVHVSIASMAGLTGAESLEPPQAASPKAA